MALINCKECDTEFSTLADKCPKCGAPTSYSTGVEKLPATRKDVEIIPTQSSITSQHPPTYEQTNIHHHHTQAPPQIRYISTLLFIGVIFFPLIFYWFLFRKGHTTFARVVGGIWLAVCLAVTNNIFSDTTSNATTQQSSANSEPDYQVDAMQLFGDYQRNEVAADEKYKGKTLLVTGIVDGISKDFTDDAYIQLATDNMFMTVKAKLQASEVSKASRLSKGQWVVVKCRGDGMIVGSPMLSKCTITDNQQPKKEPEAAIPVEIPTIETKNSGRTMVAEPTEVALERHQAEPATNQDIEQSTEAMELTDNHSDNPAYAPQ